MSAVSTKKISHDYDEASNVISIQHGSRDAVPDGETAAARFGGKAFDATAGLAGEALDVGEDMRIASSMVPREGYDLRNRLIFEDESLTVEQKITESYRNDRHYAADLEKACACMNRTRDNKARNLGRAMMIRALAAIVFVAAAVAAGNPSVRAKILGLFAPKTARRGIPSAVFSVIIMRSDIYYRITQLFHGLNCCYVRTSCGCCQSCQGCHKKPKDYKIDLFP